MSGLSHRRRLWTKRTAQLAACGLLAASASLAVAGTAVAVVAGNNGTVKINGVDLDNAPSGANDPHVTCPIILTWGGFDAAGADFTVTFTPHSPTHGTVSTGGALAGHFTTGSHQETYSLAFTDSPQPNGEFHVTVDVQTTDANGSIGKSKTVWVNSCGPDLSMDKSGTAGPVAPSAPVSYDLAVTNVGGGLTTAGDTTTVTDTLPAGLEPGTMIKASGAGTWTCNNNTAGTASQHPTCTSTSVFSPGDVTHFTVDSTVSAGTANGTYTDSATVTNVNDKNAQNNTDTQGTQVQTVAAKTVDMSVAKSGPATATVGDTVTYTVTATVASGANALPTSGTTTVSDTLPGGLTSGSMVVAPSPPAPATSGTWTCNALSCSTTSVLQPGDTATFKVTATASGTGKQTNTANVSTPNDANANNNQATFDTTVSAAAVVNNLTLVPQCTVGTPGQITWTIGNPAGNPSVNTLAVTNGPVLPPTTLAANTTTTFTTAAPQATALTATGKTTPGNQNVSSSAVSFNNSCAGPIINPGETPATVALTTTCTGFHAVFTTASQHTTQFTVTKPSGPPADVVNGSDARDYAADATNSHISVAFDGQNTSADWVVPAGCVTPTPTPTPTPPAAGQADPGVTAANHCQTGINLVLSNMNGTAPTVFTVTAPDGTTEVVPVGAGQIKKLAFAVEEDTTAVATVRAPGLAKQTFTYDKNCASVLGVKHVRKPQQPKPTKVEGEKSTLPFTGFNAQRALMDGAALLFVGALLCGMASRRRGRFEA